MKNKTKNKFKNNTITYEYLFKFNKYYKILLNYNINKKF